MRLPRRSRQKEAASAEDTQEMFAAGQGLSGDPAEQPEPVASDDQPETEPLEEEELPETGIEPAQAETIEDEPDTEDSFEESFEEEEEWDETYEEWDDDPEDDDPEDDDAAGSPSDSAANDPEGPARTEGFQTWLATFRARTRTIGAGLLGKVGSIKLPSHEIDGRKVLAVAGISVVTLMVGAAGYFLGKGSGEDVDTARLTGEFAGKKEGAIAGATQGYAAGFRKGREAAFRKSYAASYRRNYIRAYRNAGMDPPDAKRIEVPKP